MLASVLKQLLITGRGNVVATASLPGFSVVESRPAFILQPRSDPITCSFVRTPYTIQILNNKKVAVNWGSVVANFKFCLNFICFVFVFEFAVLEFSEIQGPFKLGAGREFFLK